MKSKAAEVMSTTPVTIQPMDSIEYAYQKMSGFRHLPVTDDHLNIIGVLSSRDLQRAMLPGKTLSGSPRFKEGSQVAEYMSYPITTVDYNTPFLKVVETMIGQKISSILVTSGEELVGIITSEDLLYVLAELLKQKRSYKEQIYEKLNDWAYHSPIGQIVTLLSEYGL